MFALRTTSLLLILIGIIAPVAMIVHLSLQPQSLSVFLPTVYRYGLNTLFLVLGTSVVAFLSGVIPAFFISRYQFLGRRVFRFALLLPLALPAYLLAYVYADFLEYAGPVQSIIREIWGFQSPQEYPFIEVRSLEMACLLLGVGLSPYVYAFCLATFDQHAGNAFETARVLGLGPVQTFFRVILPLARPAWVAGIMLVAMETIADFGAVEHLAVDTLTLGIFTTWLERGDLVTAARLAMFSGTLILIIALLEGRIRGARGFSSTLSPKPNLGFRPSRSIAFVMFCSCLLPLLIGFIFPVLVLMGFAMRRTEQFLHPDFLHALGNTLYFSGTATVTGTIIAFVVAISVPRTLAFKRMTQLSFISYMLPATIFALGLMLFLVPLGNVLQELNLLQGAILGGTIGLIYGYVARFFALAHGVMRNGVESIPASIDDAGKLYSRTPMLIWWHIRLPMLRSHFVCAGLLLFVETLKELPLTLIMRPAGTETLATHLYHYAGDENLALAAPGALVIVAMGTLAVTALTSVRKGR